MQMLHFRVPTSCNGMRLNIFLRTMGVSSACIKAVKYQGTGFCVRLGDEVIPVHTDYRVATAQIVSFALPPEPPTAVQPEPLPIDVIYEDEFAAVLNKPAGIAVHPTLNHTSGTLANGWLYRLKCRGEDGVFRRSTALIKTPAALCCVRRMPLPRRNSPRLHKSVILPWWKARCPLGSGRIDVPIARRGDSIIGRCVREDGKPSVTEYTVLAASASHALVSCFPVTGRTHQIRVHFSWLGHPLAGDSLYGGHTDIIARHALHCAVLRFNRPADHEPRRVQSPLPEDFLAACCAAYLPDKEEIQTMLQSVLPCAE